MQMNGGYFGSMLPQGASSFMPQGSNSSALVGGVDGTPQSLTSPPLSQQLLTALTALSSLGGAMGGSAPTALPPNSFSLFAPNGGQPQGQSSAQGTPGAGASPFGALSPDMIKALLAKLGIGGGASAPAAAP